MTNRCDPSSTLRLDAPLLLAAAAHEHTMSSKLDYLSKYGAALASQDDVDRKRSKKDKKKKHKSKHHRDEHDDAPSSSRRQDGAGGIQDMDDLNSLIPNRDDEDDVVGMLDTMGMTREEEGPTVVDAVATGERSVVAKRGFETVKLGGGGVGRARQRQRHDSDSEDEQPRRQRHDSSDDSSGGHRRRPSNGRRQRHDSDASEPERNRRRHDSDVSSRSALASGKRGGRGDGHRRRHDSDSEDSGRRVKHRSKHQSHRRRHDSDSEDGSRDDERGREHRKRRHDSDSEEDNGRDNDKRKKNRSKRRHNSDSEGSDRNGKRMKSGHKSGLQTATDFAKAEKKLRKKQRDELSQHNLDAETGETVYRDASGKRKTTSTQQKEYRDLKTEEEEKAMKQKLANKGSKQRMEEEARVRELEEVAGLTLARGVEDTKMEERKKQIIREGDPMAMYAWKVCVPLHTLYDMCVLLSSQHYVSST